MKSVVIVGAGGSLAQASRYRRARSLEHPPLDTTFFRKAEELAERHSALKTSVRSLRRQAERTDRFYDPFKRPGTSLEQYFADVYYEVVSARSDVTFSIYVALLRLYAGVLAATTNWMANVGRPPGLIGRMLRYELDKSGSDSLTIITFNHDLVIENEVTKLPRTQNRWCLSSLYGDLELDILYGPEGTARFPHHNADCVHEAPILLLKLHGSLNWVVRQKSKDPAIGTLFPTPSRERSLFIHDARSTSTLTGEITMRSHGGGRQRWYGFPVIVPPIYDKQNITGTGVFQDVWAAAAKAIEAADRLVLFGYSLPEADVIARQMIRRAFESSALDSVSCINPDPSMAVKLESLLAPKVIQLFRDMDSYLDERS